MSENTFKYKDKRYRFSMEGEHVVVIELHHDGKWWPQCQVVGLARPGIIALLRERTARADVFARLKNTAVSLLLQYGTHTSCPVGDFLEADEVERDSDGRAVIPDCTCGFNDARELLDALQAEWERGGA